MEVDTNHACHPRLILERMLQNRTSDPAMQDADGKEQRSKQFSGARTSLPACRNLSWTVGRSGAANS